ncbi:MAG: zinc ribbon domain-containing protein [Syntrophomonadaceae bacterium]|nr:zinc ribbon domain-containing protein [Syntrophomonadaceae bacterium]
MPIFDFQCQECGRKFDLMISNADKAKATCPECKSNNIKQMLSLFNTGAAGKSAPVSDNCSSCSARTSGG